MRALVIDDEPLARNLIKSLLADIDDVSIVGEGSDGAGAVQLIGELKPDLVFLDIDMPGRNGVDIAREFAANDDSPYFVIVTAHGKFAIDAFEFAATDFLLKPISKSRLVEAVSRARAASQRDSALDLTRRLLGIAIAETDTNSGEKPESLVLRKRDVIRRIRFSEIVWVEAANQYTRIHTVDDVFMRSESLGSFARQLDAAHFIRVHRSAIVNGRHIQQIERGGNGLYAAVMANGMKIQVARSRTSLIPTLLEFSEAAGHRHPTERGAEKRATR